MTGPVRRRIRAWNDLLVSRSSLLRKSAAASRPALAGFLTALPWWDERAFPATWLGLAALIALTVDKPAHLAFRRWLLAGMVHVATVLWWYPRIASDGLNVSLFSGVMVGLLLVTWDAFRFGVFGYVVARMQPRGWWGCFVWPIVWVGLEFIWPHIFPWRLGHTQIGWLSLMQLAESTGVYGVSFLLLWGAAATAVFLRVRTSHAATSRRRALSHLLSCGAVVIVLSIWGQFRIRQLDALDSTDSSLAIALVQPGRSGAGMRETLREESARVRDAADLIVWPESTIDDFSPELTSFSSLEVVKTHAGKITLNPQPMPGLGRPLLCAGGSYVKGTDGPHYNTAYLVDADERIIGRYHKRQLMPWGEYVVGQHWIPGVREMLVNVGVRPGDSADPLVLPGGERIGTMICYEDLLSEPARDTALAGGEVLINLMNLSVFGDSSAMWGHQQIARLRTIETRRWLLRCGVTGSTSVVSPTGRVAQQAPPHTAATLVSDVPLLRTQTFYTRHGDLLPWACLLLSGLLLLQQLFLAPARRAAQEEPHAGEGEQT